MSRVKARTTAVFVRPFRIPGLDEELPAGEYALETELEPPSGFPDPESWRASVLIHLHPKDASPGLARTLTVPLADLERAEAEDRLSGRPLAEFLLDELLADPMVRLFMASDGITEDEMRRLHSCRTPGRESPDDR
jgi:hypothetical protein